MGRFKYGCARKRKMRGVGSGKNLKARKIGQQSERVAITALKQLERECKIKGFRRKNFNGIDFVIFLWNGGVILLQIKSSERWLRKHREKHFNIPVVVVHHHYPDLNRKPSVFNRLVSRTKLEIREICAA